MSDLTYSTYRYHLFVVDWMSAAWLPRTPTRDVAVWVLAVLGSAGVGWVGRRVLRDRARFVTG